MSLAEEARRLLVGLTEAGIAFIVVGGSGALIHGVPMVTYDLDIVPSRAPANVERLLAWLLDTAHFTGWTSQIDACRRPETRCPAAAT